MQLKNANRVAMTSITGNVVVSDKSHNGGWTAVTASLLKNFLGRDVDIVNDPSRYEECDTLIFNEGVNYREGQYNFFGGVPESVSNKICELEFYSGSLVSVNEKIDVLDLISKRKELSHLKGACVRRINPIDLTLYPDFVSSVKGLIIGDSHSISSYIPGYAISRNDGQTLHGFLNRVYGAPDSKILTDKLRAYDDLVVYFGNIDMRFHLFRQHDPHKAMIELLKRYVGFCEDFKATPVCLLPIEPETRKIPGTGQYEGKNFYGSREERARMVEEFNGMLELEIDCLKWPSEWYEPGFDVESVMEARQSVHLRPTAYRHWNDIKI